MSPRIPQYSPLAKASLMEQADCKTVIVPAGPSPAIDMILEFHKMQAHKIPSIKDLFGNDHFKDEYEKTLELARSEPFILLHTSGSTSLPKSILFVRFRVVTMTPAFHAMAILQMINNQWKSNCTE